MIRTGETPVPPRRWPSALLYDHRVPVVICSASFTERAKKAPRKADVPGGQRTLKPFRERLDAFNACDRRPLGCVGPGRRECRSAVGGFRANTDRCWVEQTARVLQEGRRVFVQTSTRTWLCILQTRSLFRLRPAAVRAKREDGDAAMSDGFRSVGVLASAFREPLSPRWVGRIGEPFLRVKAGLNTAPKSFFRRQNCLNSANQTLVWPSARNTKNVGVGR